MQENFLEIRLPDGSMDSTCTLYEFSVVASNELATGDPGNVTGGFPIGMLVTRAQCPVVLHLQLSINCNIALTK